MGWFHKKSDPISDRARALNDEIAALEEQIKTLDNRLQRQQEQQEQPRLRSTALPLNTTAAVGAFVAPGPEAANAAAPAAHEPIFEDIDQDRLKSKGDAHNTPEHYNELGVRKYDLPGLWRRLRSHFQGPSTTNPKLVSYLAAGGIQGFRPLRYEKRVARNRFILLAIFLFIILLGLLTVYVRR